MSDHLKIPLDLVISCHELTIEIGGGVHGVKNEADILSALGRPHHEPFGTKPYPTVIDKAGCLLHSLSNCHGFNDGNKRTAWFVSNSYLYAYDYILDLPEGYKWYDRMALMIKKHCTVHEVIDWMKVYAKHDPDGKEKHQSFRMSEVAANRD